MTDTESLELSHKKGSSAFGQKIRIRIEADHGRWTEARSLRAGIKKVLRGKAEIVEVSDHD